VRLELRMKVREFLIVGGLTSVEEVMSVVSVE